MDGNFLYLTDFTSAKIIHKVNLATGTDTYLNYTTPGSGEMAAFDLAVVSPTLALFSTQQSGSGNAYTLHTIDLTTGLRDGVKQFDGIKNLYPGYLWRSADRNSLVLDPLDPIKLI